MFSFSRAEIRKSFFTRIKGITYKCTLCDAVIQRHGGKNLRYHYVANHAPELPPVECPLCDNIYKNEYTLSSHIKRHHTWNILRLLDPLIIQLTPLIILTVIRASRLQWPLKSCSKINISTKIPPDIRAIRYCGHLRLASIRGFHCNISTLEYSKPCLIYPWIIYPAG